MDIIKRFKPMLLRGAILVAVLVAFTLFINLSWFDEALHPDLVALTPPQPVSMDDNAFPLLYGIMAADDRDARAVGLAVVAELRQRYARGEPVGLTPEELEALQGSPDHAADEAWQAGVESIGCNSRFELDCAERMIDDVADADLRYPRLGLLLRRYEQVLRTPRFEENQEFDATTPLPFYALQLARIRLALSFGRDTTEQFLRRTGEDLDYQRRMLREGQALVSKMVALAGIRNDLAFLSAAMRRRELTDAELETMRSFLSPLTSDELDIGETFIAEMRISLLSHAVYVPRNQQPWLARLTLQENATLNEAYLHVFTPLRLRAGLSTREFYRLRGYEPLTYDVRAFPPPLYNLGGKLTISHMLAGTNIQDYISRTHDLNGRILLALLHAEIEANPGRDVSAIVAASRYRNPYTGEPMDYDAAARTIGFECLSTPLVEVCRVPL